MKARETMREIVAAKIKAAGQCSVMEMPTYKELADSILSALDKAGMWIAPKHLTSEMCAAFWQAHEAYEEDGATAPDCYWEAMLAAHKESNE